MFARVCHASDRRTGHFSLDPVKKKHEVTFRIAMEQYFHEEGSTAEMVGINSDDPLSANAIRGE
jgi:hypothetical protein